MRRGAGCVAPLVGVVVLLVAWEGAVRLFGMADYTLPAPSEVAEAMWRTRAALPRHLWATVSVALGGLVLGAVAGAVIAAGLSALPPVRRALQPLLVASQSVPAVVLAPLFIVWFGFGTLPRLLVVALVVFFPITVATTDGLVDADPELVDLVRAMGASRIGVLVRVRVPNAAGAFLSGLRIAAAYAMFGAVVAEFIGAEHGLAIYLNRSADSFRTDQVFVAILLIAAISVILFTAVAALGRVLTPWRTAGLLDREDLR